MCKPEDMSNSNIQDDDIGLERIESPSGGKVPKWLEDMSENVQKKRPGSWKLSQEEPNYERGVTPNREDLISSGSGLSAMLDDLHLNHRSSSRGSDIISPVQREGSARHGRRAITSTGSKSAGNSPRKSPLEGSKELFSAGVTRKSANSRSTSSQSLRQRNEVVSPAPYVPTQTSNSDGRISRSERSIDEREVRELSLEESWSSLSFFDRRHKGRLTRKLDDELLPVGSPLFNGCLDIGGLANISFGKSADFIIPELPTGQLMVINIRSTWGDRHYLGLNGIEIFSSSGEPVTPTKISAEPADINVLPEYNKDPRIVKNLLDGVNRTHDDMHLWLAPFTPGENHVIQMIFQQKVQVAMIRIWNYNKSRIHSYRGVRDVEISLDGITVFQGEIARACGGILGGTEAFGDTILFTTDENILESISQFDDSFSTSLNESVTDVMYQEVERPITAHNGDERPFTCAGQSHAELSSDSVGYSGVLVRGQKLEISLLTNWGHPALIGLTGFEIIGESGEAIPIEPQNLQCNIRSPDIYRLIDGTNVTSDESHMWDTGFLDSQPVVLTITFPSPQQIACFRIWNYNSSPDLVYCGVKLLTLYLDGKLVSPGCQGIAAIRRAPGNCHFNFAQDLFLAEEQKSSCISDVGIKSPQIKHSYSDQDIQPVSSTSSSPRDVVNVGTDGSRELEELTSMLQDSSVSLVLPSGDTELVGRTLSPRGSMSVHPFDVDAVERHFNPKNYNPSPRSNTGDTEYEAPVMPQGFVFQLLILSTWGDMYYVGLNGLELYNEDGDRIRLTEHNIGAFPDSVNILEGISNDVRTPEKLVDGVNDTLDGRHMWLSPILPNQLNRVYIVFDYPVTVSMIKLWNYSKTPNRGVKEFGILVDDLLIYNGVLDKASFPTSDLTQSVKVPYRTVLFTSDKQLRRQERSTQVRHSSYGHHVQLLNDHQRVTSGGGSCHSADQSQRPLTSLVPNIRSKSLHNL